MKIGTSTVTAIYLGTTSIVSAYLGATQVFGGASVFTPLDLFSGGAQGVWLDPSDLSTMFSDRAGTTAVTAPGQLVGLRLDKSKGLVLGAELVTNGTFDSGIANWTSGLNSPVLSWVPAGAMRVSRGSAAGFSVTTQSVTGLVVGKTYVATAEFSAITSGLVPSIAVNGVVSGTNRAVFRATATTHTLELVTSIGSTGQSFDVDNISLRELAGNHAVAPTDAARPIYGVEPKGGRRNLLTWSEDFRNTAAAGETRPWTYTSTAVTPNADGVADLVYPLTSGIARGIERGLGSVPSATYTNSIEAKASGLNWLYLYGAQGNVIAYFNLSTGAVGTVGSGLTASISGPDAGGYYRCAVTHTANNINFAAGGCDANGSTQATASGTNGVLLRNAQLELGSTATNYQRVTTAYNVTESGVASCHYVQYDGVNGFLQTSVDANAILGSTGSDPGYLVVGGIKFFTATVAASAFARSAFCGDSAGYFGMWAHTINGGEAGIFQWDTGVKTAERAYSVGSSAIITGRRNPLEGAAGKIYASVNGVSSAGADAAALSAAAGTIVIGKQFGTFMNGRDFGIIIVGKAASAGEITDTETWLAAKTAQVTI